MGPDEHAKAAHKALSKDPKYRKGEWDEERAWLHVREVTKVPYGAAEQYLQSVADRVQGLVSKDFDEVRGIGRSREKAEPEEPEEGAAPSP